MKKMMMTVFAVVLMAGTGSAGYVKWDMAMLLSLTAYPGATDGWTYTGEEGKLMYTHQFTYALVLASDIPDIVTAIGTSGESIIGSSDTLFLDWNTTAGKVLGETSPKITGDVPKISTLDAMDYALVVFTYYDDMWYYSWTGALNYTGKPTPAAADDPPPYLHFTDNDWNAGNGAWIPIPEPTAMALLALGAAAVGLRRRFRK